MSGLRLVRWNKKKIKRFWNIYQADERYEWTPIWSEAFSDFLIYGVNDILKKIKNAKILDIGCGSGYLLKRLKQLGFKNLYGIDASKRNIKKIKDKEIKCICGDITKKITFENKFFDVVFAVAVLEHLMKNDLNKVLGEINRILKNGGLFIIEVPYKQHLNYALCPECLAIFEKDEHLQSFDEMCLENILKDYGFRKKKVRLFIAFTPKRLKSLALRIGFSKLIQKMITPTEMLFIAEKVK